NCLTHYLVDRTTATSLQLDEADHQEKLVHPVSGQSFQVKKLQEVSAPPPQKLLVDGHFLPLYLRGMHLDVGGVCSEGCRAFLIHEIYDAEANARTAVEVTLRFTRIELTQVVGSYQDRIANFKL